MSESIGFAEILAHNAENLNTSDPLNPWTGVRILWDGDEWDAAEAQLGEDPRIVKKGDQIGFAGDISGRVLEVRIAFGQRSAPDPAHLWDRGAENLLAAIQDDVYSPFDARNAVLDPAFEIGDTVTLPDGSLSVIYGLSGELDGVCAVDASAPPENALNTVYPSGAAALGGSGSSGSSGSGVSKWEVQEMLPTIPAETIQDAIYNSGGMTADLIVNSLSTTQAIRKYLADSTSDDNHIEIYEEQIAFVAGLNPSGTEQATNPLGELLYWVSDPKGAGVTTGSNGYPYQNGKRILITTDATEWPVIVHRYTVQEKLKIAFEREGTAQSGTPIYTPTITLGAGNHEGRNFATIRKGVDGLEIMYTPNEGDPIGIKCTTGGELQLIGWNPVELVETLPETLVPGKFYAIMNETEDT